MEYLGSIPHKHDPAIHNFLKDPGEIKIFFRWQELCAEHPKLEDELARVEAAILPKSVFEAEIETLYRQWRDEAIEGLAAYMSNQVQRGQDPLLFMRYRFELGSLLKEKVHPRLN